MYSRTQSVSKLKRKSLTKVGETKNATIIFFFHILNGDYKVNVGDHIIPQKTTTSRTKHSKPITPLNFKTDSFKHSFLVQSIDEWNTLPQNVVKCCDLDAFEKAVLEHL